MWKCSFFLYHLLWNVKQTSSAFLLYQVLKKFQGKDEKIISKDEGKETYYAGLKKFGFYFS